MHAAKPSWTSSATAAMRPPTLQTVPRGVGESTSGIGKPSAGAARQLHSRAVAGPAHQVTLAKDANSKQVVDLEHFFCAQFFSNRRRVAPMLAIRRSAARLSTKLSTAAVDGQWPWNRADRRVHHEVAATAPRHCGTHAIIRARRMHEGRQKRPTKLLSFKGY